MQEHSNSKTPRHDDNPCAVSKRLACRGVSIWRSFGGNEAHSYAETQRSTNRGKAQLNQQFLMTTLTQCPLLTRFWNIFRFDERDEIIPHATLTNRTADNNTSS